MGCSRRVQRWSVGRRLGLGVMVAVALAACGGPRGVPLTELAVNADHYDGQSVVTNGVVLEFGGDDSPIDRHYVLQDADVNRVELVPADVAEPHVGSAVEVTGEFEYHEERGRKLHVETIEAVRATR